MNTISRNLVLAFSVLAMATAPRAAEQTPPAPAVPAPPATPAVPATPAAATNTPAAATNAPGPLIAFETPNYDFGKVNSGDPVKYTYIFTNIGDETLYLTNVAPSCGCTTAGEWTKVVEPGKTGVIPVQFNSAGYPAGPVLKMVTVTSNDKLHPSVGLQLKGTIWKAIDVVPPYAILNIPAESMTNVSVSIRIVNNLGTNITLLPPESNNKAFTAELKNNESTNSFELIVTAVQPLPPGNAQGQITIKSTATNLPVISITAWANVAPVIVLNPPQLLLPAPPLMGPMSPTINIQNNGTNNLVLSEPTINAKDVGVDLKEIQPGRAFTATLTFPKGFEIAQGEKVELSIKSSHPQFPLIKVPVMQMPRPITPAPLSPAVPPTIVPLKAIPASAATPPPPPRAATQ